MKKEHVLIGCQTLHVCLSEYSMYNEHIVHNLMCKVNKHIALRLRLHSMALRMLLSATVLEYLYLGAFISAILQTTLKVKGYPHLLISFHHRLQKKIMFSRLS